MSIETFGAVVPNRPAEQVDQLIQQYHCIHRGRGHKMTRVYPGVAEGLAALDGRKTAATTKGTPTTRAVLEMFGLIGHFEHVQGTDGIPYKPAPDVLLGAMNAMGASREECLMVGDSAADMEAGKRAGMKTCAVRYGYGHEELDRRSARTQPRNGGRNKRFVVWPFQRINPTPSPSHRSAFSDQVARKPVSGKATIPVAAGRQATHCVRRPSDKRAILR